MADTPRYALLFQRRVRILEYLGERKWLVLDHNDQQRLVHGSQLTFIKGGSK